MRKLYAMLWASAGLGWRDAPTGEPRIGRFHVLLLALLAVIGATCTHPIRSAVPQPALSPLTYLPIIAVPPVTSTPIDPLAACLQNNPQAVAFYRLLVGDSRQERPSLACHPALVRAAERRAASLIASGLWSHCDPAGVCSNTVARNMGCVLPKDYSANGNQIESLVGGSPDVGVMFAALATSPGHAPHLFGRGWFRHQRHVGIAYVDAPGSRFGYYWVALIATCEQASGEIERLSD
ncbi:MAG: CAP domain-containing protein [Desulfurellales bacterium]|nr:MAG: CAP domain-containing protein [Desulfurellales bacterium]